MILTGCGASAGGESVAASSGQEVAITSVAGSPTDAAASSDAADGLADARSGLASDEELRIVSTTVAITEIMDRLNLDLVGVPTSVKTLPARYDEVTRIGNPMSPDMEIVRSLNPTHVLSVTTLQYDLEPAFKQAGLDATFVDLTSVDSLKAEITRLGEMFGRTTEARAIIDSFESTLEEIRQLTADRERPTVLILMGVPGSYLVATEHSYIGDLVRLMGGINIVQGETVEYLASNTEYLYQSNPDVILRAAHGMPEEVIKMFDEEFKKNDIWKHFEAVKQGRVYDLEEALFGTTANLYVAQAMQALLPMLYP